MTTPIQPPPSVTKAKTKPFYRRWWFILGVIVVIAIIAGTSGGGNSNKKKSSSNPIANAVNNAATTAPAPTDSLPASAPTPTPTPTPPPKPPKPKTYTGSGDDVIRIKVPSGGLGIVTATYTGSDNFIVDARGNGVDDNIINTIGHYHGTTPIGFSGDNVKTLQIQAVGPWTFRVASPLFAPQFTHGTHGVGDAVIFYRGHSDLFHITNTGSSDNIIVDEYDNSSQSTNLVNEIGHYSGTVEGDSGPGFIVLQSTGDWTVRAE